MKKLLTGLAALAVSASAFASQPLLSPTELQATLSAADVRVIDIRDPKSYATGHIQGAVSAPYGRWRGPADNPGDLPPLNKLTELVQSIGLTPQTHAIVVSSGANDTDFGAAARVYWTLKVLGVENLSILNGGVKAWQTAGLPLDKNSVSVAASTFTPTINDSLLITRDELAKEMGKASAILVDARPEDFFTGKVRHGAAKVSGTLEGAVNVSHSVWFKPGTSQLIDAQQAKAIASKNSLALDDKTVVSFCNTGHWAATNWFVLSELVGDKNVKLYAGSMVDYTQSSEALRMKNVPNRFQQLTYDVKNWWSKL